jgi:spore germination cell wall hydrolase CwlJ-like protein
VSYWELATEEQKRLFDRPKGNNMLAEVVIVALTIQMEAAGEIQAGKLGVGGVIARRAIERGMTPGEVCLERKQFSGWNRGYGKVAADYAAGKLVKDAPSRDVWDACLLVARIVVAGELNDCKYNHYYNPDKCSPSWGPKLTNRTRIGNHIFGTL